MTNHFFKIIQDVKVKSVEIPRYPDVVIVYYQVNEGEKHRVFMWKKDFEKLSPEKPLEGQEMFESAILAEDSFPAYVMAFRSSAVQQLDEQGFINWYSDETKEWKIKWGATLPDDMVLMGCSMGDWSYYNMDGSRHVHPIAVSPCELMGFRASRIEAAIESGEIQGVRLRKNRYGESTDYVPGNGMTVYASIILSPEEFVAYKNTKDTLKEHELCKKVFADYYVDKSLLSDEDDDE